MDDSEYDVGDVRSPPIPSIPSTGTHPVPPGRLLSRRARLALAAGSILLALIVIVSVWLPLQNQPHTVTGLPSPTARSVLAPTPLPITSTLASPPTSCPSAPALTTITVPAFDGFSGSSVQLTGRAPVWIPAFNLPQRSTGIPEPTPPSSASPAWPSIPIIWEVGPTSHPTVTVKVHDLHSGTLAWWAIGGSSPQMPILVLVPPPDEPTPGEGYLGYLTVLFITHASCYEMNIAWPGGSWSFIFAAGWGPTYLAPG